MNEDMQTLSDKKVILGVTGGIAAYKSAEIVRALIKLGAEVRVVMTRNATEFITPITLGTLSGGEVSIEMFSEWEGNFSTKHISLADWADIILVAPATANFIGRVACGLAEDLLSTVVMATTAPVVLAPSMNDNMFLSSAVEGNMVTLKSRGVHFVDTSYGYLACGRIGKGRLADIEDIIDTVERTLLSSNELSGRKVLVTAGRTEEDIDPVRFITNRSTGKMGYALAHSALFKGAEVVLVSGPSDLRPTAGIQLEQVRTASEMNSKVVEHFGWCDVLLMAAAVSDYRPVEISKGKLKKAGSSLGLKLEETEDILASMGRSKGDKVLVGFAVETEDEIENARKKLERKKLDLIVLNNPLVEGAGFGTDTNIVTMVGRDGKADALPKMSKFEVAGKILARVVDILNLR
jgi:phosphopantothenoylcysteine decarboxylase/phosphopantothenate--cysteine ligase